MNIYIIIVLVLLLGVSIYYNIKFALILINMEDALEKSLDVLDQRYASMSKVLEIPLFFDSPQIRQVIDDIRQSRDSILYIANLIGKLEDQNKLLEESGEEEDD